MTLINSIKKISKNLLIVAGLTIVAVGGLVASPSVSSYAQSTLLPKPGSVCPGGNGKCPITGDIGAANADSLPVFASKIAQLMTFIIASIAIIFVLYGAFLWLTDAEKGAEKGRKIITNAVIALVISVVAYGLIGVVISFLSSYSLNTTNGGGIVTP